MHLTGISDVFIADDATNLIVSAKVPVCWPGGTVSDQKFTRLWYLFG
jgi:hypothetical protein